MGVNLEVALGSGLEAPKRLYIVDVEALEGGSRTTRAAGSER